MNGKNQIPFKGKTNDKPIGFAIINIHWTDDAPAEEGKSRAADQLVEKLLPIVTLGERLGCQPLQSLDNTDGIFVSCDKKNAYDIFEILDKFIEKMDIVMRLNDLLKQQIENS